MNRHSKIICFDFDDVVTDGDILSKLSNLRLGFKEIKLGIELLEDNRDPKKFFGVIKEFVKLGKGMKFDAIEKAVLKIKLMKGVHETFKELKKSGSKIVIVSMNDERLIKKFLDKHNIAGYISHIYASRLGVSDGKLTGIISGDIIKTEKLGVIKIMRKHGNEIIYIGDGLTDLPIMKKADKGILFCPNEITKAEVFSDKELSKREGKSLFVVEKKDLREVLRFI